eukprot:11366753-Ditylum_brightwellii.AAC.1
MRIEANLSMESTFADKDERNEWFDTHLMKDKEDKKDYDLRRVPTITCELKYAPFVAKNLFLAFSNKPLTRFMTKGTNLQFVPESGVMAAYDKSNNKRSFPAFLTGTTKVQTTNQLKVMIAGFIPSNFHCLLTEKEDSPFYISPFTLASEMPRSKKDDKPAFHQLGK